jgi:beta-fructofuranosidase
MYAPDGFRSGELGDIEVIPHEGRLHLFHLTLPNHDRVAHLVSDDGLRWERRPDALRTGPPGAFDDDMIWTVSVTNVAGQYHMLYTALCSEDGGRVQRVGLAVSDDLEHWTKHEGPVSEPDSLHYEDRPGRAPWASWRDPKPVRHDDGFATMVCARDADAPARRAGAVACLRSNDLRRMQAQPPLFAPRRYYELECPQAFTIGGRWFLTASVMDDRSQRYWVAPRLEGPWRTPSANRLLPPGHYAARVFRWNGMDAVLGWVRDARGHGVVVSPMRLATDETGRLWCAPWPAWQRYEAGPAVAWDELEPLLGNPDASRNVLVLSCGSGMELWATQRSWDGVLVRAQLRDTAGLCGLAFGLDDEGHGWFVELDRGEGRCRLVRQAAGADHEGRPWFTHEVAGEALWVPADDLRVELRIVQREVELAIGGRVILSAIVDETSGRLGFFVDSGHLALCRPELTPMRSP